MKIKLILCWSIISISNTNAYNLTTIQVSSTILTFVRIGITTMLSSPMTLDATTTIGENNTNGNMTDVFPSKLNAWIADTINNTRDQNVVASPIVLGTDESRMEPSVLGTPLPVSNNAGAGPAGVSSR
jgi:hypothetical protein